MKLLDEANTAAFGDPVPTQVPLTIEKRPVHRRQRPRPARYEAFLLEQTKDRGVNIYTHSEMLPAHGYPELKKHPHLKGNFGTAGRTSRRSSTISLHRFCSPQIASCPCGKAIPTACSPHPSSLTRSCSTSAKIKTSRPSSKALECGGYKEDKHMTGMNGGHFVTTGFAHNAVLSHAEKDHRAHQSRENPPHFPHRRVRRRRAGRSYYTDFAKLTPSDTLILTLACGNTASTTSTSARSDGLPRILDCGQCNDAYSAIKIALALSETFDCTVNDLPSPRPPRGMSKKPSASS